MAPSRAAGATGVGVAGAVLLLMGHAPWPVALLGGSGAVAFAALRTIRGVWLSFGLLLLAALAAWLVVPHARSDAARQLLPWITALEVYGIATVVAVRSIRQPVQVSRRLLGAWLASTGAIVLGLSLSANPRAASAAGALVTFGLLYKLGVVPAYAWAPMLIRHPSPFIEVAGVAGMMAALLVLLVALPAVGNSDAAAVTAMTLAVITVPWAAWMVARQWRSDRRCAVTYAVVALMSGGLLWFLRRVTS